MLHRSGTKYEDMCWFIRNGIGGARGMKKKERIVYVVDDHFELPKKYLNMSTEEIDELIRESKEKQKKFEKDVLSSK